MIILGSIVLAIFLSGIISILTEELYKNNKGKYSIYLLIIILTIVLVINFNNLKKKDDNYLELLNVINNATSLDEVKDYIELKEDKQQAHEN